MRILQALKQRHLAILWSSQVLSAIGDRLYTVAVIWIAVRTAGSGGALVAAAQSGSAMVLGLLGGVYADRWNRRAIMIVADVARALAVLALTGMWALGVLQLWHLVVVAIVVGGLGTFFDPALQASLPILAGDTRTLQATNGLMDATKRVARAVGPALAGLLVSLVPLAQFFTIDAISFAISATAILSLGSKFAWQPERRQGGARRVRGVLAEIVVAARSVRAHPLVSYTMVNMALVDAAWSIALIVGAALLSARELGGGIGAYGLIVGAYGAGNVLSNLVVGGVTIRRPAVTIFAGKMIIGIGFLLMAAAPSVPVAMLAAGFAAVGGPMGDLPMIFMLQTDFPGAQIGKVYSLSAVTESGGAFLGLLLAAPLYAHFNTRMVIALSALVMVSLGAAGLVRFGRTPVPSVSSPASYP